MITVRQPDEIHKASGKIQNGTFHGHWHFSFDRYRDAEYESFGNLLVFNDETLSPGAAWPLHPHRDIELVTYCAGGEFRHADEYGSARALRKGWVQHTTVGRGMWHSEINNLPDQPARFIQMWFKPVARDLIPSVEQLPVTRDERKGRFLPVVSSHHDKALPIFSDAEVYACFLEARQFVRYTPNPRRGIYLYVVEGGPILLDGLRMPALSAAMITGEGILALTSADDTELLLVDVLMA